MSIKIETIFKLKCLNCKFEDETDSEGSAYEKAEEHINEDSKETFERPNRYHRLELTEIKIIENKWS